ncbi:hypothetical protein [Streptomyces sp. NPDC001380]|uniref:hypothetical protein n=1 Tax=Streptomyces sp. NPDC001380 TaxID=3364566 RepID=UPI00368C0AA1
MTAARAPEASETAEAPEVLEVPDWPCPTVAVDAHGRVQVDGIAVPVPGDVPPDGVRPWILRHVAERHQRLGRPIRVTAVDPDGTRWPMVVHPDGTAVQAPAPPAGRRLRRVTAAPPRPGRSQARGLAAAAVFTAAALGLGALGLVLTSGGHHPDQAPQGPAAPPRPTAPPGANLPVPAPPGWTTRARWAVALAPYSRPAVAPDGSAVAVLTPDRRLAVLDPATGGERWSTGLPAGADGTLVLTRIDGTPVAALLAGARLYSWPLDGPAHPRTTVTLPDTAAVSVLGTSPLVSLPDQTAGVVSAGGLRTLDVPVGATALAADGTTVTAAAPSGRWLTLTPGRRPGRPRTMAPPARGARLLRVVGLDGRRLAGLWQTGDRQQAAVYDTATGRILARAAAPGGGLEQATACVGTGLVALGPLVLDTAAHTSRTGPAAAVRCAAAGGRIYLQDAAQTWYDTTASASTPLPAGAAVPVGVAAGQALVVADKLQQHLLYALLPGRVGADADAAAGTGPGGSPPAVVASPLPPGRG